MIRWIWIIWVTICCMQMCSYNLPKAKADVPPEPRWVYVVRPGDTLDGIAKAHGTTWRDLWTKNPQVKDPNMICVGERLALGYAVVVQPKPLTNAQKVEKLARLMFRVSEIPMLDKAAIEDTLLLYQTTLKHLKFQGMDNQRYVIGKYTELTRQHEIWELSEAIVEFSHGDDEMMYKLAGLAWHESHFVNRIGKCGEVSFYQFLPSTVKEYFKLDSVDLGRSLWSLKNEPRIATCFATLLIIEHGGNWSLYNHGEGYQYQVNNKIYMVKQEFKR